MKALADARVAASAAPNAVVRLLALLAMLPLYARRGDRLYVGLGLAQIAVLLLAASGVLTAGH